MFICLFDKRIIYSNGISAGDDEIRGGIWVIGVYVVLVFSCRLRDGVMYICQGVSDMGKCMGVLEMRDLVLVSRVVLWACLRDLVLGCRVVLCTGECWGMRIAVRW